MKSTDFEIGIRVRETRESFNETREQFCKKIEISSNHLGKIERGESSITKNIIENLVLKTGVSADYILFGTNTKKSSNVKERIIRILEISTSRELKIFFNLLCSLKDYTKYRDIIGR